MILIKPSFKILTYIGPRMLTNIELAGRTCYKSENRITSDSSPEFVNMIIKRGHESVLEHQSVSVLIICDRGVSHELVRHRIASFSQESTRYCNYSKDKFGNQLTFIIPSWSDLLPSEWSLSQLADNVFKNSAIFVWMWAMKNSEEHYLNLIEMGWTPQQARSVLPNSLKTEIVITANLREWRTIFRQRTSAAAHPQMREIMIPLLKEFTNALPEVFSDIKSEE